MKALKVRDYMSRKLVTFHENDNIVEATKLLVRKKISGAPVVDEGARLVGMLSEIELMEAMIQDSYYDEVVGIVADCMDRSVPTVPPDMDIYTLAEKFHQEHRQRYPVVENGKLIGQISRYDVLRAAQDYLERKK